MRDLQSGTSTISGNFTATNFAKSGPGTLLLSGTANVMAPITTQLYTMQINEGAVQFAGQSSLPSNGNLIISPMDAGVLDLAGVNLTIAGLGGNAAASAATGNVLNSGTLATLTVAPQQGATSIFNGLISGTLALKMQGVGTLTLGYNNTYTGGTTIGAGNITSANGAYTPLGTLTVNQYNGLGSGPVTLAGGILNLNAPGAGEEVIANQLVLLYGPGSGYNVTVSGTNNFGSSNTTSTISVASGATSTYAAINNLTLNAPVFNVGTTTNGLLIAGTTALSSDTLFNNTGALFLAGRILGSGSALTKVGAGVLYISTPAAGVAANSFAALNALQGTVEIRTTNGDNANVLGSSTTPIMLNGGATLNMRHDGDSFGDAQVLTTFANNPLIIGSTLSLGSSSFVPSANVTLSVDRTSGASYKTVQFGQLRFGGAMGTAQLQQNVGNSYSSEFTGGLAMLGRDAALNVNQGFLTIDGNITGNGTVFKQGGNELDINTNSTGNTGTGGLVLAGGDTYFAGYQGVVRTLNTTAKAGQGTITIQPGARLFFSGTGNLNAGQLVDVRSNLASYAVVGIADNSPITAYNLRAPFTGGPLAPTVGAFANSYVAAPNTGSGVLAINSLYTQALDLSKIGDGTWFLGSTNNGEGMNGTFNGGTLGAGAVYN
ncbi:MAG: hypothetical protein EBR81_10895, partial [Proteobacteria bacterium]|nr:hypothetical protein [Pseudomonadota bacterium]